MAVFSTVSAFSQSFRFKFSGTSIAEALSIISRQHPDLNINFIYDDLEDYSTDADVATDDPLEALRLIAARNPIFITRDGNNFFCEAMQKGKYHYHGSVTDAEGEPIISATLLILSPTDSTVVTFGISDSLGRFSLPCDRTNIILKITSLGYQTSVIADPPFDCGAIILGERPLALKSVTVEASNATVEADKSVFIPSSRQKNAAASAIDLLRHMAIPLIQVNPSDDAVTDNFGQTVPLFINSVQASPEEIGGINIADVRRVEILDFPTDPRFHNVPKAINIIVQQYLYGGYTKLSLSESCITGLANSASVFSKFTFRRMTYDLYFGSDNSSTSLFGSNSEAWFTLGNQGSEKQVSRVEALDKARLRSNQFPITFRATYATDKVQLRNTVSFTHSSTPQSLQEGTVTYSSDSYSNGTFRYSSPRRFNSVSYSGNLMVNLPNGFSFSLEPSLVFTHRNNRTDNTTSTGLDINRLAKEDATFYRADLYLSKQIGRHHTINLECDYGNTINSIHYSGTYSASDHYENPFASAGLMYKLSKNLITINFDAGICWEWVDINNLRSTDAYPYTHLYTRYTPDNRNSFEAYFQFANNTPGISMRSNDILRENDMLYITGNPDLKNSRHFTFHAGYTWLPSNMFNLSVFGRYFGVYNRAIMAFNPYFDGTALIRNYINDGDFNSIETGGAANLKFLDNALQFYARYTQVFDISTGSMPDRLYRGNLWLQSTWYVGSGYIQAYWSTPSAYLSMMANNVTHARSQHGLTLGWGNSKIKLSLTAANLFNRGNRGTTSRITTPLYSDRAVYRDAAYHPRVTFVAAFTIGYGRKVNRDNEIGIQSSASSGILSY